MIVKVDWIDSATEGGWQKKCKTSGGVCTCYSVGFVIRRNKRELTLAQSKSEFGNIAEVISIPTSCIKSIKQLED